MRDNEAANSNISLPFFHRLAACWFLVPIAGLIRILCIIIGNDWREILLALSPYLLISMVVFLLLLISPRRGRVVALWTPPIIILLTMLSMIYSWCFISGFEGLGIFYFAALSLFYIICLLPIYLFLNMPSTRNMFPRVTVGENITELRESAWRVTLRTMGDMLPHHRPSVIPASLPFLHRITAWWYLFVLAPLIIAHIFIQIGDSLLPLLFPYILLSITVHRLLLKSPYRGRLVAQWAPPAVVLLTSCIFFSDYILQFVLRSDFHGDMIGLHVACSSLIYTVCLLPIYLFLNMPSTRKMFPKVTADTKDE